MNIAAAVIEPVSDEYNLRNVTVAMAALYEARNRAGMKVWELEDKSGASFNAVHAWKKGLRYPQLSNIVAVAQTLGFDIVMRSRADPAVSFNLRHIKEAMCALNEARQRIGFSTKELREISSVSLSSFYSWFRQERDPTLGRLVDLAESLGFEIIMRPRTSK